MTTPKGLSAIPLPVLEELLSSVERGRLECPFAESDLADCGFRGPASDVTNFFAGADTVTVLTTLRAVIAERIHRPPPHLDLVWTGPETRASVARSTALVVERLFESARRCVIVGGYTFDRPEILAPLHRAMAERNVEAWIFVDIDGDTPDPSQADAFAGAFIDAWFRRVWTFGLPKPDIFYDPRTAISGHTPGHEWATLHAKCIVVDDERSFITSANFTDRGQSRNIEAGVLIEDRAFSEELAGHWRQLVGECLVRRYRG
jgi:phosphatidylserine/phosphatidylglycerophosphate/cardiolipin synthase-like enzyme